MAVANVDVKDENDPIAKMWRDIIAASSTGMNLSQRSTPGGGPPSGGGGGGLGFPFASLFGGGGSTLPSTQIGTGAMGPIAGGTGLGTSTATGIGGLLGTIGNIAGPLSQILGGIAGGRQQGQQTAADIALGAGNLANNMYGTQANAAINRGSLANNIYGNQLQSKVIESNLPTTRAQQAARGGLMANVQDVQATGPDRIMNNVVHFTGGLRPSALGPDARAAGSALASLGRSQLGKDIMPTAPGLPDLPTAPTMPNMPKGGLLDQILSNAGLAASLMSLLKPSNNSTGKPLPKVLA